MPQIAEKQRQATGETPQLKVFSGVLYPGETLVLISDEAWGEINNALSDAETFTGIQYTKLSEKAKIIKN